MPNLLTSPVTENHAAGLLEQFLAPHRRVMVLTGAGISAASGIPTYRDHQGRWQRSEPIQHQDFVRQHSTRQRYWLRASLGWGYIRQAQPNAAHDVLADIEDRDLLSLLVTQNVDGLHQRAGSRNVVDLHGRIDQVICLDCGARSGRAEVQQQLLAANPWLTSLVGSVAPDGDAEADPLCADRMQLPCCGRCGGILKPDVVFFGANVPVQRVSQAMDALDRSDALLVIGSSLQVYSGFRFARRAAERGIPLGLLNLGSTRADSLASVSIRADILTTLTRWHRRHQSTR